VSVVPASDGQLSSSATTTVTVNPPSQAGTLFLSPVNAGPDVVSSSQTVTALLQDANGNPIPGEPVTFVVSGANSTTGSSTTDITGTASFSFTGANSGSDYVQAKVAVAGVVLQSNVGNVSWIVPIQPVSAGTILGRFYLSDGSDRFDVQPNQPPVFTQTFSNMAFNADMQNDIGPPIPGGTGGVGYYTVPYTNVDLDGNGNFAGTTIAQGNGEAAGKGEMGQFQAVFTGQFTVAQASTVTFNVYSDDGFQMGIGGGAVRVGGIYYNPPASGVTAFNGYPIMGLTTLGAGPPRVPLRCSSPRREVIRLRPITRNVAASRRHSLFRMRPQRMRPSLPQAILC